MPLSAGDKLGPYEIRAPLGAGGMGEVYRANDTRLDRTVAIKVLLASLSSDPSLKQRLEREAKAVPSPHLHAVRRRPQGRHGFSRHGISGRRDPGTPSDARTVILASGEVLIDMASGKLAFSGPSRASLIAAILTTEPPSITQLQPLTPVTLERVVKKCLAKAPDARWQSAADLASELQWMCTGSPTSQSANPAAVVSQPKLDWKFWGMVAI